MFGLFKRKRQTDPDFLEWAIQFSEWTIASFGGLEQIRKTPLVKPTSKFYPTSQLTGHELADEIFRQTKKHADMGDWECSLVTQQDRAPDMLGDSVLQKYETNTPAGTYSESVSDGEIISQITYDPKLLGRPTELVATFSHELAHLLMPSAQQPFPFDEEMLEPATDSLAIMMGFGIFILNGSSEFRSDDQSWEYHRAGYLCEGEIFHVLSAFCILSETPIDEASGFLKSHHYKRLFNIFNEMNELEPFQAMRKP